MAEQSSANVEINKLTYFDKLCLVANTSTPKLATFKKVPAPKGNVIEVAMDTDGILEWKAKREGTDVTEYDNALKNAKKVETRKQEIDQAYMITKRQLKANEPIGVADQIAKNQVWAQKQLMKKIEYIIGSNQEAAAANGEEGDKCRGLGAWIDSTNEAIPEMFRTPASQCISGAGTLTMAQFDNGLASLFEITGEVGDYLMFANTKLKSRIKMFERYAGSNENSLVRTQTSASSNQIKWSVDIYDSDYGFIKIIPDAGLGRESGKALSDDARFMGFVLNPNMVKIAIDQDVETHELEDKGAGPRGYCDAIFSLIVENPLAQMKITA